MSLGVDVLERATPFSTFSGWRVSDWDFFNLKCSCGSWRRQLVHGGVEIQKSQKMKKKCVVTTFFKKTFFHHHFQKWKNEALFAHGRDQKLPTQTYMYVLCVCVLVTCWWHGEIIYKVLSPQNQPCGTAVPQNRFFEAPWRYNVAASTDFWPFSTPKLIWTLWYSSNNMMIVFWL